MQPVSPAALELAKVLGDARRARGDDYLWAGRLPDGRLLVLMPWSVCGYQLAIGERGCLFHDDTWYYRATEEDAAWRAVLGWDGDGEPEGWYRHPHSGRRRPDGTPESERGL